MISINKDINLKDICKEHWLGLKKRLNKRINKYLIKVYQKTEIFDFLISEVENIITAEPNDLLSLNQRFNDIISAGNIQQKKKVLKQISIIFDYSWFCTKTKIYYSYHLANKLGMNVCPYCNANFTLTVGDNNGNKVARPSFDHFFSKSKYPLLAISFYNLIPSCNVCNSDIKGALPFSLTNNFHPYIHNIEKEINFDYRPNSYSGVYGFSEEFDITIEPSPTSTQVNRIQNHIASFKLEDVYQYHKGYATEIIEKSSASGASYIDSLKKAFPKLNLTDSEFYRLAYGNYLDDKDLGNRPMSKMTRDLVKKLDKIK